jgi:hypothetical protein
LKKDCKGKKGGQSEAICSLNETEVVRGERIWIGAAGEGAKGEGIQRPRTSVQGIQAADEGGASDDGKLVTIAGGAGGSN